MEKELNDLEHAFWNLVDLAADNLPEDDPYEDDPETLAYIHECHERFEADKEEFASAIAALRKKARDVGRKR